MSTGVNHFNAKLDPDKVRAIRSIYAEERAKGRTHANIVKSLAMQFGVTGPNITLIIDRITWREVK